MDINLLRAFTALESTLHFGRAAEQLGLTQPVLSRRIQRLESELGISLFERSSRQVSLSAAGEAFAPLARQTLSTLEMAVSVAQSAAQGEIGQLRIGFVGSAGYRIVPALVRRYRERYPSVRLELQELTTAMQVGAINAHSIDAGFGRPPVIAPQLASRIVWSEPMVAVVPDGHPLCNHATIALGDLEGEGFILPPRDEGPGHRDRITAACMRAGFTPRVVQEALQLSTAVGLAAAGLGVTIVPDSVRDFRLAGAHYLRLANESELSSELALVWDPEHLSPTLEQFIEVCA